MKRLAIVLLCVVFCASCGSDSSSGDDDSEPDECVPDCVGRECGLDPACGQSCGSCALGLDCYGGSCIDPTPTQLGENGDTCASDEYCASGYCSENGLGEKHCYGDQTANESCLTTYDCLYGICQEVTFSGVESVCLTSISHCEDIGLSISCITASIAFCRRWRECGDDLADDFDRCVSINCDLSLEDNETDEYCLGLIAPLQDKPCD